MTSRSIKKETQAQIIKIGMLSDLLMSFTNIVLDSFSKKGFDKWVFRGRCE